MRWKFSQLNTLSKHKTEKERESDESHRAPKGSVRIFSAYFSFVCLLRHGFPRSYGKHTDGWNDRSCAERWAGWVSITCRTVGAASEVASENSFHTENGPGNHHRVRLVGLTVPWEGKLSKCFLRCSGGKVVKRHGWWGWGMRWPAENSSPSTRSVFVTFRFVRAHHTLPTPDWNIVYNSHT